MRGTLASALLLAASSQIAAESHHIDPRQLSHYVANIPDESYTKSLSLRGRRKQPVDVAANETRTIENAITSALHGITDPSTVADATRGAVREILDLNAFPEEVVRPQFDLNFPPSETSAHLSETSDIPQTKQASTSTVSDTAVSSSHTSNQDTAKTLASLDMGHKPMTLESASKTQLEKPVALERQKSSSHGEFTSEVEAVYKQYLEHLQESPERFEPTQEETGTMLSLAQDSITDAFRIAEAYNYILGPVKGTELENLKKKLGTNTLSTLRSLASLKLPPRILGEIQRPFVWYASHMRWRAMYCNFFEFYKVHIDQKPNEIPTVEFHGEETNGAVDAQAFAKPSNEMDSETIKTRIKKLERKVDARMAKYNLKKETEAAVKKVREVFAEKEMQSGRVAADAAAPHQPGNQRTDPDDFQVSETETNSRHVVESNDNARQKRLRTS